MAGHKILVIDDSKVIRMRVRDMLPDGNFEVLEAKDGAEGLDLIRNERPNLIMLDFLLPKLSGWEVYQELQQQQDLQKIPLVIMSGRKEEVTDKLQEPFEFFEFIEKPFEKHQLQEAIKGAIEKSKRPRVRTDAKSTIPGVDAAEIAELHQKMERMEAEIANLKRTIVQLVTFVKQKL
ncbi:response regulator [Synechococcales cyanobacterium C]|uniref:Response regulator n=1 Tax=Petrachloros mirabilis ULC683 TaxID=2781853 RepID=A0A8K2A7Z0_9CYAN|nr:response regulator [Petrachloros mirabilis ULC683]